MDKSSICVDFCEFAWQSWHNICLEFCEGRTLNVELVVALRALSVALASETHTHTQKNTEQKEKKEKKTQAQYQAHRYSRKSGSDRALGAANR